MVPYFSLPALLVAGHLVTVFGILFYVAIATGVVIFQRRARRAGIGTFDRWGYFLSMLAVGLTGAAVVKAIGSGYPLFPHYPLAVLSQNRGIASMGGFCGGFLGGLLFCLLRRYSIRDLFAMLDAMAYAAPFAWLPGRLGCFLVHDHRGLFTSSWLGVRFPEGTRYDLGLIEFLFLIPLSLAFWYLGRRTRPRAFFFALFGCVYGVFRIGLDSLHYQPHRFIAGSLMTLVGIGGWLLARRLGPQGRGIIETVSVPNPT